MRDKSSGYSKKEENSNENDEIILKTSSENIDYNITTF